MTTLNAVIIDDEQDGIEVIKFFLSDSNTIEIVGEANSVFSGINLIKQTHPDIVFLDVEMTDGSGFDLLNTFESPTFKVVFITGYDHYAIRAIKYSAIDYLLKPIAKLEIEEAIERIVKLQEKEDQRIDNLNKITQQEKEIDRIIINSHSGFRTLMLDEIVSIESKPGNYALFYTEEEKEYLCTKPIKYYESLFPTSLFNRIHKSYIINLSFVTHYNNKSGTVTLLKNKKLEVAHRRRSKFNEVIKSLFS